MKSFSQKKITKIFNEINRKRKFIPEYAENYALMHTGDKNDINHYDLTVMDQQDKTLVIRKTIHGNRRVDILILLKTPKANYVNVKRRFNTDDDPLKIYCMSSEKEWRFSFDGYMRQTNQKNKEAKHITFKATFKSDEPMVDLFNHIDYEHITQKPLSNKEKGWLKNESFKELVSYQQDGVLSLEMHLNDEVITLNSQATRKHDFGKHPFQGLLKFLKG